VPTKSFAIARVPANVASKPSPTPIPTTPEPLPEDRLQDVEPLRPPGHADANLLRALCRGRGNHAMLKMVEFAATPRASVSIAMPVNAGDLCSVRKPKRMSCQKLPWAHLSQRNFP
jgi:hypothetical protein